jgi:hypothetical protein
MKERISGWAYFSFTGEKFRKKGVLLCCYYPYINLTPLE